jgi:hypothetical protein
MKKLIILLIFIPNLIIGQEKNNLIEEVIDIDSISIFNNIQILDEFKTGELRIRFLTLSNMPGSAGFDNGEVTKNLFISISEFDEFPEQKLYVIKNLYSLKIEKIETANKFPLVTISFIANSKRETINVEISLEKISIN